MLSMVSILIFGSLVLFFFKSEKNICLFKKIAAALFFGAICLRLVGLSIPNSDEDMIFRTTSILSGRFDGIFSKGQSIAIILLRWGIALTFGSVLVSIFFNGKVVRIYNLYLVPIIILLETIFFNQLIYSYTGEYTEYLTFHRVQNMVEIVTLTLFFFLNLKYELIFAGEHHHIEKADYIKAVIMLPIIMIMFMPMNLLYNLFGYKNQDAKDYNLEHITYLLFIFVPLLTFYFFGRKKDKVEKEALLDLLAFAAFYQYFSVYFYIGEGFVGENLFEKIANNLSNYPFHICNTAVIFMPIALSFHKKGLFYFTYFVNVLGALFAVLMPDTGDAYSIEVVEFWYNHGLDIIVPILSVGYGVFERPNFKNMLQGLGIFALYIIFIQFFESLSNYNLDPTLENWRVDYFFLYGNKFTNLDIYFLAKFAYNIKFNYIFRYSIGGYHFYIYYLNTIAICLAYILFSFVMWFIYDRVFLFVDDMDLIRFQTRLKKEKIGKTSRKEINEIKARIGGRTMIKISHFSKRYGSSKDYAVKDFSLTIEDGDVFGFIGHNGAGKSTVIKSLVGIQSITEGTIEVCGYDIEKYPLQAKLNIGYVSDNHAVYEKLTGREYINYVADLYQVPKEVRDERINHYANMFGLTEALDKESKSYSHGMKQKLVVISSLIHDPKVWVLDEPLTGLDPTSSFQIKECMKEHAAEGNIVFFSTHVIEVIEKLCTKIAIIAHGKLMGVYRIEDLKKQGISLESLYLKYVVSDESRGEFSEADIATTDAGLILEKQKLEGKDIESINIQNQENKENKTVKQN